MTKKDDHKSNEASEDKTLKKPKITGKTLWDIIGDLFAKKPTIVVITLFSVLLLFLILIFAGLMKFEIIDGKVSLSFDVNKQPDITNLNKIYLQEQNWCVAKGIELNKKYILKTIVQTYDAELKGTNKDTLVVKERIIYDIFALQDITKVQDIFKEGYSSNVAFKVERWFGSEREKPLHMGNESTYYVHFDCKQGESITLMTGADFYYTYPLKSGRHSPFREYNLNSNEDLWIYPNEEDVIGKLTMIWASYDIKLQSISGNALHTYTNGKAKINDDRDAFYNFDENSQNNNNSVSASWKNILPDEQFALKIKWHEQTKRLSQ